MLPPPPFLEEEGLPPQGKRNPAKGLPPPPPHPSETEVKGFFPYQRIITSAFFPPFSKGNRRHSFSPPFVREEAFPFPPLATNQRNVRNLHIPFFFLPRVFTHIVGIPFFPLSLPVKIENAILRWRSFSLLSPFPPPPVK